MKKNKDKKAEAKLKAPLTNVKSRFRKYKMFFL